MIRSIAFPSRVLGGRRGRTAFLPLASVALVPLAFAGLVVGSLAQADTALERIPAAVVNEDELVQQTAADGTETPVFAGRQLVTELTGSGSEGFDWTITNADDAESALASGEVYAVLTVPENFSASILSLQGDDPERADLELRTDDAHSYLTAAVADTVGSSMATAFGREITAQYLGGLYSSIGILGQSLGTAADGADQLATGATDLGAGLGALSAGAASAQSGAASLASGVAQYTGGVSSLSRGLADLSAGARGLSGISSGVSSYTGGVAAIAPAVDQASRLLADGDPANDAIAAATLAAVTGQLNQLANAGNTLSTQTATGIRGIQGGISQSAAGAARLAAGSGALTSGSSSLSSGLGELSAGAADASSGAGALATGAAELSQGLRTGAEQVPVLDEEAATRAAEVASEPVGVSVDRDNEVSDIGRFASTFFVPLGLWIGAMATFLVLRPLSRSALTSTAADGRVLADALGRALLVAAVQAAMLTALVHVALGVDWAMLPATLTFALVMALAFTAFHHLLTAALGRGGLVISLLILALQVTATGGLYPIEILSAPFQAMSPLLPLTYGVSGMQALLAGGDGWTVVVAALALLAFGLVSALLSLIAVRRMRRVEALRDVVGAWPARA